jgi:putative spermidine/putrescine transport system permease protein
VPHTVAALLVLQLLSRTGMLGRFLFYLGILSSPGEMGNFVFDPSGVGVIVAYLWKGLPFAAVVVAVVLRTLDPRLCEAALVLGASRIQVFWYVLLPLLFPTLSSTFVLLFGFSFGAFEVPFLLGPTFPQALPVAAYKAYLHPDMASRPYAMVYVVVITAMALGLVFLYGFLARRGERFS